jgi:transglutaminase-like putative cysteine protease
VQFGHFCLPTYFPDADVPQAEYRRREIAEQLAMATADPRSFADADEQVVADKIDYAVGAPLALSGARA